MRKNASYLGALLCSVLFLVCTSLFTNALGQTDGDYRSIITGNWSSLGTWERYDASTSTWKIPTSQQGYPGDKSGTGNVLIQTGQTIYLQVSPAYPIGSLTVGTGNNTTLTLMSKPAVTLVVSHDVNVIGGSLTITNINGINSHMLRIGGDLNIDGSARFNMVSVDDVNDNCTVVFDGKGAQSIGGGAANINFYNIILQNNDAPVFTLSDIGVHVLTIENNAILSPCPTCKVVYSSTGSTAGKLSGSGTVRVTNTVSKNKFTSQYLFPLDLSNLTVDYAGMGNQLIERITGQEYKNIILSGSGTKSFEQSIVINGILLIEGAATTAGYTPNYGPSATLQYKGSIDQITGPEFPNTWTANGGIIIDNERGVTLSQNKEINSSLTLKKGHLVIPVNTVLTINNNAVPVSGGETGFTNAKHIVTKVSPYTKSCGVFKVTNVSASGFTFPIGDGNYYLPATLVPSDNNSFNVTVFTGFTADGKPGTPLPEDQRKNVVNAVWDIIGAKDGTTNVTLEWPEENRKELEGAGFESVLEEHIGISQFDGIQWETAEGISDFKRFTAQRALSSFAPITVAIQKNDVLPVHFFNVRAVEIPSGIEVKFTNLTESDVAYYEIERCAADRKTFYPVKRLFPVRNDFGLASYTWIDESNINGRIMYRVKAVETTGKLVYSNLVNVSISANNSSLNVFAIGDRVTLKMRDLAPGKYLFHIVNPAGQVVYKGNISHGGGALSQVISLKKKVSGVYIIDVKGPVQMQKKFFML